ncbi:MAG: nucleotidyltransferase family protein [Halanaerobiaceae bacterium]
MVSEDKLKEYRRGWEKRKREKEEIIRQKKKAGRKKAYRISQLLKNKYQAQRVILFGSLSQKSEHPVHQRTDIDIAFRAQNYDFFELFGEASDIAEPFQVDLVPLEEASSALKNRIKYYGEEI